MPAPVLSDLAGLAFVEEDMEKNVDTLGVELSAVPGEAGQVAHLRSSKHGVSSGQIVNSSEWSPQGCLQQIAYRSKATRQHDWVHPGTWKTMEQKR